MLDFAFDTLRNLSSRDVCAIFEFCPDPPQINLCTVSQMLMYWPLKQSFTGIYRQPISILFSLLYTRS
ncbi:hypothetical protein EG68_11625 [Paragonimus skrjabini miyazakii]|uniref:Uncharacterized protein n=1 Tax=Paragonimus skrjabini miyazakii TaxID=59628 RepID=A0A8S9YBL7_9TREM|nr:hypothetical protein EG68_11625 [Paragonimus skrjabini miyazakii]